MSAGRICIGLEDVTPLQSLPMNKYKISWIGTQDDETVEAAFYRDYDEWIDFFDEDRVRLHRIRATHVERIDLVTEDE